MRYQEISGNLITLAQRGMFDVIAHGCNCFCRMKKGIAPQMAEAFGCDKFPMEMESPGNINKLGQIDYQLVLRNVEEYKKFFVVNAYTQYKIKKSSSFQQNHPHLTSENPFDYEAFTLCMRKINTQFANSHVGLPKIGSNLAGGDWHHIKSIIQKELKDCNVTVVIFEPSTNENQKTP